MWMCVALAGVMEVVMFTLFRETYEPAILRRRAAKKRKETGDNSWLPSTRIKAKAQH